MEKKSAMQNMAAKPAIRLPLPIGVADYRLASTEYYYIDKTLMIKEFLDVYTSAAFWQNLEYGYAAYLF